MKEEENGKIESGDNNASASIVAGVELAGIEQRIIHISVGDQEIPVVLTPSGMSVDVMKDVLDVADERADRPRRLRGTAAHFELASFIEHINRFKNADSVVFADPSAVRLQAVFDYHAPNDTASGGATHDDLARWAKHRSSYACPLSEQWKLWTGANGREMSQEAFAQFIEDNMVDLSNPTAEDGDLFPKPAAVLEMARKLAIHTKGEFSKEINATTGEGTLVVKNEHTPASTKIPKGFILGIPVFEAGEPYRVEARLRFSMPNGRPSFSFSLYQADAIKRDAFNEVRELVKTGTSLPVFAGSPEQ